jgi:hypothetical protein
MKLDSIKILISRSQFGYLSYASFFICIISGIALAFTFDPIKPDHSISLMILLNKPAMFIRSLHYWSAQIFLITSVFHIIDHLLKGTEKDVKSSSWVGMIVLIPFLIYAMFSGFLLKGDNEANQGMSIIVTVFNSIPFIGKIISGALFGVNASLQIVYINHIITSTLVVWLLTIEHSKKIIPSAKSLLQVIPLICILSVILIPSISVNSVVQKGPWYLTGMQEIFHWLSYPEITIYILLLILVGIFSLKYQKNKSSAKMKIVILVLILLYSFITIFALFFRGESWRLILPWQNDANVVEFLSASNLITPEDSLLKKKVPLIQGKIESCMYCHSDVKGLSVSHDVAAIGCYSCHLGEPLSLDKNTAHRGMTLTPGNLDIAGKTCGNSNCHPGILKRVGNSLMTSMSGVVAVNKYTFGESKTPDGYYHIENIGFTPAETHLRGLCAGCHLSNNKLKPAPIDELSRGGGCSACHLNYQPESISDYEKIRTGQKTHFINHPEISIKVTDGHCFGCHSRSGRIATNYEGWHETHLNSKDVAIIDNPKFRLLQDGRVFEKKSDDVHHRAGMICIDCHNSYEIMGDGTKYSHKENAVKIECIDCHSDNPATVTKDEMDQESQKILNIMNKTDLYLRYIVSKEAGIPYVNSIYKDGRIITELKSSGKQLISKPVSTLCGKDIQGHNRMDCATCHTAWAPQCIGCHTQYYPEMKGWDNLTNKETIGSWLEKVKEFYSDFPTLGVTFDPISKNSKVTTFIPGMVLSISKSKNEKSYKRLFAPAFSHTISAKSVPCKTCHNNPVALGFGRGELKYVISNNKGRWIFSQKFSNFSSDNLPEDAWIGFLQSSKNNNSTRTNTRPFTIEEQKNILTIGSCFTCHKENDKRTITAIKNYPKSKKMLSKKCILPTW